MEGAPNAQPHPDPIPADDPGRALAVLRPADDPGLRHVAVAGGVYTVLLTGADTAGRFCLVEMRVPPGGGPPPHRHDFEETFRVLEGQVEFSFRGEQVVARTGETVNVPANAPHSFRNASGAPARLLCICSPAGQEELFLAVGVPVAGATAPAPRLGDAEKAERRALAEALAPRYRTEFLPPV
ncbi:MAG TPA: cupin domain-containing protein [Longimicrobiaceae bacterium]|jgi:mannose-6-phosphate isomerase-like protein (cupin superfamily)